MSTENWSIILQVAHRELLKNTFHVISFIVRIALKNSKFSFMEGSRTFLKTNLSFHFSIISAGDQWKIDSGHNFEPISAEINFYSMYFFQYPVTKEIQHPFRFLGLDAIVYLVCSQLSKLFVLHCT